ncbi:MAG TPA: hypothetical protein VKJ01_22270, partial [Candidatus Solibacter sp.]|nr:hypothetical protein [Candidatus Solibacter sp.]
MSQRIMTILLSVACFCSIPTLVYSADEPARTGAPPQDTPAASAPGKLVVTVGKSLIIDSPLKIQR